MQNAKLEASIKAAVQSQVDKKLFDHCYFEVGFLNTDQKFKLEHLPSGKKIFDLSSLTKAFVTTPLVFSELEKKSLPSLDSTIENWIGETKDFGKDFGVETKKLTVSSLLRHEAGLPFWKNFFTVCNDSKKPQDLLKALNQPERPNIGKSVYSDLTFLLLGICLERKNNKKLSNLFLDFKPKNFKTLGLPASPDQCISTGFSKIRERELLGEVHDDNAAALGGFTGHTGLFSSGEDLCGYLRFLWKDQKEMFAENGKRIVFGKQNEVLMGLRQGDDFSGRAFFDGMTMGHYGFTGTAFWIEPKASAYVVLLTNRVKFSFVPTPSWRDFRKEIFALADQYCRKN